MMMTLLFTIIVSYVYSLRSIITWQWISCILQAYSGTREVFFLTKMVILGLILQTDTNSKKDIGTLPVEMC